MITGHQQEQASLYVLGALTAAERHSLEAEFRGNGELREFVRSMRAATALIAQAAPMVVPPAELRDKVLRRIENAEVQSPHTDRDAMPGFRLLGANDPSGWKSLPVPGAWIKLLSIERDRGYAVLLGKLEAGVRYPAHTHLGAENIYVLSGDLHVGDHLLGPGDFHHADAGTSHGVNYSLEGCTLLAVLPAEHELVQFAMT